MTWLLIGLALFVAFSNGANDNFKGFATVWGSDTLAYRPALALATLAALAGSLASLVLADGLLQQFSGKGLVPDAVAHAPAFIMAVAAGTAWTVLLATRLGLPVSTTHALIGGLIGAGLAQHGEVHVGKLAQTFLLPLLLSPMLAALLGAGVMRWMQVRKSTPATAKNAAEKEAAEKDCACIVVPAPAQLSGAMASGSSATNLHPPGLQLPHVVVGSPGDCAQLNAPVRVSISRSMDRLHIGSAMLICFARAVNDTPKLAALLLAAQAFNVQVSMVLVGAAMAVGGILLSGRVAQTMSRDVTSMDHAQGLRANLITASLVLLASKFGLPVSTTHVALGSIAGVGASAHTLHWPTLRKVLLSWVATLPLALAIAALASNLFMLLT